MNSLAKLRPSIAAMAVLIGLPAAVTAQSLPDPVSGPASSDETTSNPQPIAIAALTDSADREIAAGLANIYAQIDGLDAVAIAVESGVVTLQGTVSSQADRQRAQDIAGRIAGVVTVQNRIDRTYEVDTNLSPALNSLGRDMQGLVRGLPLFGVAFLIALIISALGYLLAKQRRLWLWVAPNAFLAELISGAVRVAAIIAGLIVALQILEATALLGLVLGSAGIIGIALGFAVRDTVDNYVSSLMLSLRQPFRANDHVLIDDREGRVIRLTSRATVLMTLDGNHLRIPNAAVFKANILNYTRNPQRRFEFDLGVDSADDPLAAMQVGLEAIRKLPFVLAQPRSHAVIHVVGESSIVLRFFAWVDQRVTDFAKGRSLAIQAAKCAVEDAGYELPEPIYRIRIDGRGAASDPIADDAQSVQQAKAAGRAEQERVGDPEEAAPDRAIEQLVDDERGNSAEVDLLDTRRPVE